MRTHAGKIFFVAMLLFGKSMVWLDTLIGRKIRQLSWVQLILLQALLIIAFANLWPRERAPRYNFTAGSESAHQA